MKITKLFLYSAGIGILFLLAHILILLFRLNEMLDLFLILTTMVLGQLFAFRLLRKNTEGFQISFQKIFLLLCLTQAFSVIFLTLYSALNPVGENMPINLLEVLVSLFIFAGIFPLIVTTVIWFATAKKRNEQLFSEQNKLN